MKLQEFSMMNMTEQAKYLDARGTLQTYIDQPNRIYLYQIETFYVEVHYVYKPEYKVTKVELWETMDKLDPFTDSVDLVSYLSGFGIAPYGNIK